MPEPITTNKSESEVLAELKAAQQYLDAPEYSDEERQYLSGLQMRLVRARDMREEPRTEFDGMTYTEYWESNEKGANTYIEPKKNPEDSSYASGTIRRKVFAFLAEMLRFEFYADVTAFDEHNIQQRELGNVGEDSIAKFNEIEGNDEKRLLRQYELLKQGDVFVEKVWDHKFIKDKKFQGAKFDGSVKGVTWTTKVKRKLSKVDTKILCGLNVYLGNIFEYEIGKQPYIFVVDQLEYTEAEAIYGKWDRWPFVSRTLKQFFPDRAREMLFNNWRLLEFQKNKVERIRYQDAQGNEFALILNGVLMTPPGLPLPWGYPEYNIAQQHLKPINANFGYGSSIVKEMRANVLLLDDMKRIMHLLFLKKLVPARFNLTGRNVSRRVFLPGAFTPDIDPSKLPLAEPEARTAIGASEFQFVEMMQRNIEENSIGPIQSGQEPGGDPTATEVMEISKQAAKMLGTVITAASLLEWKLSWLSLYTILANAFEPIGDRVDEVRQEIVKTYQAISVERPIGNKGMGYRITYPLPTADQPSPDEIKAKEEELQAATGTPYRLIFADPQIVTAAKYIWQITMRTRPKPNDEVTKLTFNKMVADALAMFGPDVNLPELESDYAVMWDQDPKKLFKQQSPDAQRAAALAQQNAAAMGQKPQAGKKVANGIVLPQQKAAVL